MAKQTSQSVFGIGWIAGYLSSRHFPFWLQRGRFCSFINVRLMTCWHWNAGCNDTAKADRRLVNASNELILPGGSRTHRASLGNSIFPSSASSQLGWPDASLCGCVYMVSSSLPFATCRFFFFFHFKSTIPSLHIMEIHTRNGLHEIQHVFGGDCSSNRKDLLLVGWIVLPPWCVIHRYPWICYYKVGPFFLNPLYMHVVYFSLGS